MPLIYNMFCSCRNYLFIVSFEDLMTKTWKLFNSIEVNWHFVYANFKQLLFIWHEVKIAKWSWLRWFKVEVFLKLNEICFQSMCQSLHTKRSWRWYFCIIYLLFMPRFSFSDMFVFALYVLIFLVCCNYLMVQGTIRGFDTTVPNLTS